MSFPVILSLVTSLMSSMIYIMKNPKAEIFDGLSMYSFIKNLKVLGILFVLTVINTFIMRKRKKLKGNINEKN